jgi:IS5 family transposase
LNIDTTVQEKEIRFLTDARSYDRACQRLVKAAKQRKIVLRQNYNRLSKQMLAQQSCYAHAKQMKRARRCTKKLQTFLGRVIRDIERKCPNPDNELQSLLTIASRIRNQQQKDKNKIYSVHEPAVEFISKGKAHKRYDFGCKVSVAATSRGGWFVGARALHGNPYDGHMFKGCDQTGGANYASPLSKCLSIWISGYGYKGAGDVHVDKRRRGRTARSLWRWTNRRADV